MKHYSLKINYINMKDQIEKNYFHCLDFFYKTFILYIAYNDTEELCYSTNMMLENQLYDNLLRKVIASGCCGRTIPELKEALHNVHAVVDMQIYLEEFVKMKHNPKTTNIYNLTIDESYNVLLTNKQFTRHAI